MDWLHPSVFCMVTGPNIMLQNLSGVQNFKHELECDWDSVEVNECPHLYANVSSG